jgi:uncharacterized membrane protein YoaK (UPF0700 family)
MLIREGEQRTAGIDLGLATGFAGVAGAVNAAAFQATGFFSANMTGNASSLSDHIALGDFGIAWTLASLLAMFVAGALFSGILIEMGRRRGSRAIYAYSIVVEALLLICLGFAELMMAIQDGAVLVASMSFLMGLQNAATTRISDARIRTTHVSGMATDIGLGLAALLIGGPGKATAIGRLQLYLCAMIAFVTGGVLGVAAWIWMGGALFVLIGTALLCVSLPEVRRALRS